MMCKPKPFHLHYSAVRDICSKYLLKTLRRKLFGIKKVVSSTFYKECGTSRDT